MSPNGYSQATSKRFADFGARLAQSAENAGFNSHRLARATEVARATMARYWNGDRMAPPDVLFRIADAVRVNPRWLLTGEGDPEPPIGAAPQSEEDRLLDAFRRLPKVEQEHLLQTAELLATPHTLHSPRTSFRGKGE